MHRFAISGISMLAAAYLTAVRPENLRADPGHGTRTAGEINAPAVPTVPDGTPRQLLDFIADLRKGMPPPSRASLPRQKEIAAVIVVAADKSLAQLKLGDELYLAALREKFEALDTLAVADRAAAATRRDFAKSLADSPAPLVAHEARLRLLSAELLEMHWSRSTEGGAKLVDAAAAILATHPDDEPTAARVALWAGGLEHVPGDGAGLARLAYGKLAPLLAASGNPKIREQAARMDAKRLRLELVGKPIEIVGTLLDGTRFEPSVLGDKVVIVDFWATWCGPCMADIPALRKLYDAHRAAGLEIVLVSLDDDAEAVKTFVRESRVTWPILFAGSSTKFEHPIATRYGITRIPQKIVVGRDGNVVSIHYDCESLVKSVESLLRP